MLNYQRLTFGGTKEERGPRPLNLGGATAKDRLGHSVDHPRAAVPGAEWRGPRVAQKKQVILEWMENYIYINHRKTIGKWRLYPLVN